MFRQEALDRLASPERLDEALVVTSSRAWLALVAICALLLAGLSWSFFGKVPVAIQGRGILLRSGGIHAVYVDRGGEIVRTILSDGRMVKRGEVVAGGESSPGEQPFLVRSPVDGVVLESIVRTGSFVTAGTRIATIEPPNAPLEAVVYVPIRESIGIRAGMKARIEPAGVSPEVYGLALGRVASVSRFPVTPERVAFTVANQQLAGEFTGGSTVREVRIAFDGDAATASRVRWTSSKGPPFTLSSGTPANASIVLDVQRPIEFALPESAPR